LGSSKEVNGNGKRSYKETILQEKVESTRIEGRRQCVARVQEYPFKLTLKEAGPEKIWSF